MPKRRKSLQKYNERYSDGARIKHPISKYKGLECGKDEREGEIKDKNQNTKGFYC